MAKRSSGRRMWTDEEKLELIRGYEAVPEHEKIAWLKERRANGGWFYRVRQKMKEKYPSGSMKSAPSNQPAPETPAAVALRDHSDAEKRLLIKQHDNLATREEKVAFREQYAVSEGMMVYYRAKLSRKASKPVVKNKPVVKMTKTSDEDESAMVTEYMALRNNGQKSAWLRERGLNHQSIFTMKQRVLARRVNGSSNLPAIRQPAAPALKQPPVSRVSKATYSHIPEVPQPQPPAIFLSDGIAYLQVKRDIYDEVIADLKRVLEGHR